MSLFASRSTTLCGVLLLTVALLSISVQCAVWPIVEIEVEKSVPVPLSRKQKVKRFFKDPYNIGALTAEEKEHALIYETKSMYALTEAKEIEDERERLVIGLIAAGATCGGTFLLCLGAVAYWGVMVSKQRRVRYVEELEMVRS